MLSKTEMKQQYVISRFIAMIMGNVVMALGHACFNLSLMGMHPFNSFMMAISPKIGIDYGTLSVIASAILLVAQIIWGRKYIGAGTVFNWVVLGYITMFWRWVIIMLIPGYSGTLCRYLFLVAGVLLMSIGLSLYQSADMGIAPFDAVSMILNERTHIPYFWCRLFTDAASAVATFLSGGILGLGSILCVFCLGPFISFFNKCLCDRFFPQFKTVRENKHRAANA